MYKINYTDLTIHVGALGQRTRKTTMQKFHKSLAAPLSYTAMNAEHEEHGINSILTISSRQDALFEISDRQQTKEKTKREDRRLIYVISPQK
jgi:hypothetical protein